MMIMMILQYVRKEVKLTHAEVLLKQSQRSKSLQVIVLLPAHVDAFVLHVTRPKAL